MIIKNRNTPYLIRKTFARFSLAKIYSKFDIIATFNEINIQEKDKKKTGFNTNYILREYIVMFFGLCNARETFHFYINKKLWQFLDNFCTAYLDDILIYSETIFADSQHVQELPLKLRAARLFLDIRKCNFSVYEVKYLRFCMRTTGFKIGCSKVDII